MASLVKWAGWIGTSPITVVTDHKSLESWVQEYVETPSGPTGRRARWHEIFSQFNLTIVYQPGATNLVADAMSRYAYPASLERQDVCRHGTALASQQVKEMVHEEKIQSQPNDTMTCGITMDPPTPTQEAYRLTSTMRDTVLKKLGVDKNDVQLDLFASEYNFTHPVYCTADMDAFSYSWDKLLKNDNHVIWANPPFSLLNQVVTKLIMEPCRMVLVTPEWRTETWWKPLDMITLSRVYVPAHLAIYQGDHDTKILPGPHWATAVSLVDTKKWTTPTFREDMVTWVQRAHRGRNLTDMKNALKNGTHEVLVTSRSWRQTEDDMESDESDDDEGVEGEDENHEEGQNAPEEPDVPLMTNDPLPPSSHAHMPFKFWHQMTPEEQEALRAQRKKSAKRAPTVIVAPPPPKDGPSLMGQDWTPHYLKSAFFGPWWEMAHDDESEWPQHIQLLGGKNVPFGKLCVSEDLVQALLWAFHSHSGHVGVQICEKEAHHRY